MTFDLNLAKQPSIFRRLGAIIYDSLTLFGVLILASAIITIPYQVVTGSPLYEHALPLTLIRLYLLAIIAGFFVYAWTHGGQTLGMRAWRFRVIGEDGSNLDTIAALKRFGWATLSLLPAGLGLWWSLIDRDRRAWHDRRSGTRLVMLERPKRTAS